MFWNKSMWVGDGLLRTLGDGLPWGEQRKCVREELSHPSSQVPSMSPVPEPGAPAPIPQGMDSSENGSHHSCFYQSLMLILKSCQPLLKLVWALILKVGGTLHQI